MNYPAEFMAAVLTNGKGFYASAGLCLGMLPAWFEIFAATVNEPGAEVRRAWQLNSCAAIRAKGLTERTVNECWPNANWPRSLHWPIFIAA